MKSLIVNAGLNLRLVVASCTVALVVAAGTYKLVRSDNVLWVTDGSQEPYYFSVAQIQLAFLNLKSNLLLVANGTPANREQIELFNDVLTTRINLLTKPSEMFESYKNVAHFDVHTKLLKQFVDGTLPKLNDPEISPAEAQGLLVEFDEFLPHLIELATDSWRQDNADRETALKSIGRQRAIVGAFVLVLLLVVSVMFVLLLRVSRAGAAREAALEAERKAVKTKMQFLGMVSHELRSPLQSIVSALDVLESRRALPEQTELTRLIRRSSNELAVQLRDMLTLARGQTGRIELRPDVFEACELVQELVGELRPTATAKGLRLVAQTPGEPIFVVADGVRIGQLLHNLVGNAVRYTEHGSVTVRLEALVGNSLDSGATMNIVVVDTGPGLPETALTTVTQGVEAAQYGEGERRGIGLAVVFALLQQLDGDVQVTTTAGGGTTFTLVIPVVAAEDQRPEEGAGEGRLLVVDDRTDLLVGFANVCADLEVACDTALSAATALNLLAAHAYGAVLIDLDMPGKTGTELATEVKASGLNKGARLIAMTAGSGPTEGGLEVFDLVLEKPIGRDKVATIMQAQRKRPALLKS